MFNKLKQEKGITGIDLSVSLIIITMFVSIIVALSVNVSSSFSAKKRLNVATDCLTQIMEKLDSMDYGDVENIASFQTILTGGVYTNNSLSKNIQDILKSKSEYDMLEVQLKVENYKPQGETEDLVKKVTVRINYMLNNEDETLEVIRLKTKVNIDFDDLTKVTY